jgi:hypothetical protein
MEMKLKYMVKKIAPNNNQIKTNGTSYPNPTGTVKKMMSSIIFVTGPMY